MADRRFMGAAAIAAAFSFGLLAQVDIGAHPSGGIGIGGVDDDEDSGGINFGIGGGASVAAPDFRLDPGSTGPNDLPDALTINGTAMDLVLACDAEDISGTDWTCRDANGVVTLSEAGSGASPVESIITPFHATDTTERRVFFPTASGGKYYASATSLNDPSTTDDLVVEMVTTPHFTTNAMWVGERATVGSATAGWSVSNVLSGAPLILEISDGVNSAAARTSNFSTIAGSNPGALVHLFGFIDASDVGTTAQECGGWYMNGTSISTTCTFAPSTVGAPTTSAVTTIDANAAGTGRSSTANRSQVSLKVWKCDGCLPGGASNGTEMLPISKGRTSIAFGVDPTIHDGSATPTTMTRASTALIDVVDGSTRMNYSIGNAGPRVGVRRGASNLVTGYLAGPQVTNIALQSETLGTTWAAISVGDNILANAYANPSRDVVGDDIDGVDVLDVEHGVSQGITHTAALHTFSAWVHDGEQHFAELDNATVANAFAYFDTATCISASCDIGKDCAAAVKTVGAGASKATASRWPVDTTGDGVADVTLCRASITYTGTAAVHTVRLLCAQADNDDVYIDTGAAADCGFTGVEVEAFPTPTPYTLTTTASVIRSADVFRFSGASHYLGSPTTVDATVLCPDMDTQAVSSFVSIGPNFTTDYMTLTMHSNDFTATRGENVSSQWNYQGASGDLSDGTEHNVRLTAATNDVEIFRDGSTMGTDTVNILPTVAGSEIAFGATGIAAAPECLLSDLSIYSSDLGAGP